MRVLGYDLSITKSSGGLAPVSSVRGGGGWYPWIIREPFTGAWQQNQEISATVALGNPTVYACVTLIASDVSKLRLRLVELDDNGLWTETTNPAYSPVLRKPNRYQTTLQFIQQWITSKLSAGNAYILKVRDARNVVVALYVLDPLKVRVYVANDGSVYYYLGFDRLTGTADPLNPNAPEIVPASEIIHDRMCPLYHPLIGISPIYAAGVAAQQGINIQQNSNAFFANGSQPGGVLTAPGAISDETAARLKDYFQTNFTGANAGKLAVLGDDLKYQALTLTAHDAQLTDQQKMSDAAICTAFHVPAYMVGVGETPHHATAETLVQQYYANCIQALLTAVESCLDEGLGTGTTLGTEFDIDDLIWMDTPTRTKAAADSIGSGGMSPDEARAKYFGLGPTEGGDTPYMQQQMFSLKALAKRDAADPFAKPAAPAPPLPGQEPPPKPQAEPPQ
jgi:HK97 family phage portal protein